MASEAKIAANRLNAQKSTGPRTARGKAALARNALKHGLTAKTVVLFDESKVAFERFHQAQALDFEPRTAGECALVEQIAILAWRLQRASVKAPNRALSIERAARCQYSQQCASDHSKRSHSHPSHTR